MRPCDDLGGDGDGGRPSGSGRSTSSQAAGDEPVRLAGRRARRPRTAPSSASVATTVRDSPSRRDEPRVHPHPVEPVGHGQLARVTHGGLLVPASARRARRRGVLRWPARRRSSPAAAARRVSTSRQRAAAAPQYAGVGEVEHRPDAAVRGEQRDDVDDVALQRARRAEDPVHEVAQRPAEHQARAPPPSPCDRSRRAIRTITTTTATATSAAPSQAGGQRERRAGVAHRARGRRARRAARPARWPSSRATASTLVTTSSGRGRDRGDRRTQQRDAGCPTRASGRRVLGRRRHVTDPITPHRGSVPPDSPCQRASRPARSTARIRRSVASRAAAVVTTSSWSPTRSRVSTAG